MSTETRQQIETALREFQTGDLTTRAEALLGILGYRSEKTARLGTRSAAEFLENYDVNRQRPFREDKGRSALWRGIDVVLQITDAEVKSVLMGQRTLGFARGERFDRGLNQSMVFAVIDLEHGEYPRTLLADITREINRMFPMPVQILFRHGHQASLAVIQRRQNKRKPESDVLEKVTLVKDIQLAKPHRAHVDILCDLCLTEIRREFKIANFDEMLIAWGKILNISELNKRFYQELANWFFYAREHVEFPAAKTQDERSVAVIRLITRLIFAYFVKERGLIPEIFFTPSGIPNLLHDIAPESGTYYNAVLQNLFFASLAAENGTRGWIDDKPIKNRVNEGYLDGTVRRFKDAFHDPNAASKLFDQVPFLNGGLFEMLDRRDKKTAKEIRKDGFSTNELKRAHVPNRLFFGEPFDATAELNKNYDNRKRYRQVAPLLDLLDRYKFTVTENLSHEEEVALDPELLGRVFENLLASYNPETTETARKQTGSFYTPREIVDYMIETALVAYLDRTLPDIGTDKLLQLVKYDKESPAFSESEIKVLIAAIGSITVLDPACGSGAFPMGALHRLTYVLRELDREGLRWQQRQRDQIATLEFAEARDAAEKRLDEAVELDGGDYVRKLYLIEKSLFGVDVQPIAVQITKLRFFISLAIEQKVVAPELVQPLPNLETKIVAANTLLSFRWPENRSLFAAEHLEDLESRLSDVRRRHFRAQRWQDKVALRERDEELREELSDALLKAGLEKTMAGKVAAWNPYDPDAAANFFHPEWMFGKDHKDGFSLVVGNPPYVRADFQAGEFKETRQAIVKEKRYETLYEKWDLFIPFIERGHQLLGNHGVLTYIVSDAYCHAKYALASQRWALQKTRILTLDFLSEIKVFDAAVRNVIFFFEREDSPQLVRINVPQRRLHHDEFGEITLLDSKPQSELTERAFFPAEDSQITSYGVGTVELERIVYISKGMVCHAHEQRAPGAFKLEDLVQAHSDGVHSRPFVEGKHLERWLSRQNQWLEWGTARAPGLFSRPTFPELYEVPEKLISVDMAGNTPQLRVTYDNGQLLHNHSAWSFVPWISLRNVTNGSIRKSAEYGAASRSGLPPREELESISERFLVKYLLAVMNSSVARDFLRSNRRSNIHLYPDDWKKLPIPVALPKQQEAVKLVVDYILALKRTEESSQMRAQMVFWEQVVDGLVFELYYPSDFNEPGRSVYAALREAGSTSMGPDNPKHNQQMLAEIYARVFAPEHPLRRAVTFLNSLPSVRATLSR